MNVTKVKARLDVLEAKAPNNDPFSLNSMSYEEKIARLIEMEEERTGISPMTAAEAEASSDAYFIALFSEAGLDWKGYLQSPRAEQEKTRDAFLAWRAKHLQDGL